jgi:hypothetical protein
MTRIKNILGALCGACALGLSMAAAAAPERYEAVLSSMPYNEATRDAVKGTGHVEVVLDGSKLSVKGTFSGLGGAAADAHLMLGLAIGVPGPVALPLQITQAQEGTITADLTLVPGQITAVRQGRMYVQINSKASPTGTLWGWILPEQPRIVQNEPVTGHGFLPQLDIPAR